MKTPIRCINLLVAIIQSGAASVRRKNVQRRLSATFASTPRTCVTIWPFSSVVKLQMRM